MKRTVWLTEKEAAERMGIAVHALERLAKEGRIQRGIGGKKGEGVVYNANSIDTLNAENQKPKSELVDDKPKVSKGLVKRRDKVAPLNEGLSLAETLKSAFTETAAALLRADGKSKVSTIPLGDKLTLSLKEASALLGYSQEYLLDAIRSGDLSAQKRAGKWNLQRIDIDEWAKTLG